MAPARPAPFIERTLPKRRTDTKRFSTHMVAITVSKIGENICRSKDSDSRAVLSLDQNAFIRRNIRKNE